MDIEDDIKNVLTGLVDSFRTEKENKYGSIAKKISEIQDMDKPELFNLLLVTKINDTLGLAVDDIKDIKSNKNRSLIEFVYLHYDFIEHNVKNLIIKREGMCCSADKSRHILNAFLDYLLDGETPKKSTKKEFYLFDFGDYADWFELCYGIINLYYGDNNKYLSAYIKLMKAPIIAEEVDEDGKQ